MLLLRETPFRKNSDLALEIALPTLVSRGELPNVSSLRCCSTSLAKDIPNGIQQTRFQPQGGAAGTVV